MEFQLPNFRVFVQVFEMCIRNRQKLKLKLRQLQTFLLPIYYYNIALRVY